MGAATDGCDSRRPSTWTGCPPQVSNQPVDFLIHHLLVDPFDDFPLITCPSGCQSYPSPINDDQSPMTDCLISFGSNKGNSQQIIREALEILRARFLEYHQEQVTFVTSDFLVTQPVGGPENQNAFVNGVARFQSELEPSKIMALLHEVEQEFGRLRRIRWDSRTLDLDLLLYGEKELETADLKVPHPRMSFRQFVLVPAQDVAQDMVHPTCQATLSDLLECVRHRKKNILWIADDEKSAQFLDKQRESDLAENVTRSTLPECLKDIKKESYKLVVFNVPSNPDDTYLQVRSQVIAEHRGPLLFLNNPSHDQLAIEFTAAVETMKAI